MSKSRDRVLAAVKKKLKAGLTGIPEKDIPLAAKIIKKFEDDPLYERVLELCVYTVHGGLPKEELEKIKMIYMGGEPTGDFDYEREIDKISTELYGGDAEEAFRRSERIVRYIREQDSNSEEDDAEYGCFDEPFEEILYRALFDVTGKIEILDEPFDEIFFLYGSALLKLGRVKEARAAFEEGLDWNLVSFDLNEGLAETYFAEGNIEEFTELTYELFEIAFRPLDLAKCYRNLARAFIEEKNYSAAALCGKLCADYARGNDDITEGVAPGRIAEKAGGPVDLPSEDRIGAFAKENEIPLGPGPEVLELLRTAIRKTKEDGLTYSLRHYARLLYSLTRDRNILVEVPELKDILGRLD